MSVRPPRIRAYSFHLIPTSFTPTIPNSYGTLICIATVSYTHLDVYKRQLDTTVRKVVVDNLPFLLADTVGFIRKLPTDLVEDVYKRQTEPNSVQSLRREAPFTSQ